MEAGGRECQGCWLIKAPHLSLQEVQLSALQISAMADSSSPCWLAVCSHGFHGFHGGTFHFAQSSLLIHPSPFSIHFFP